MCSTAAWVRNVFLNIMAIRINVNIPLAWCRARLQLNPFLFYSNCTFPVNLGVLGTLPRRARRKICVACAQLSRCLALCCPAGTRASVRAVYVSTYVNCFTLPLSHQVGLAQHVIFSDTSCRYMLRLVFLRLVAYFTSTLLGTAVGGATQLDSCYGLKVTKALSKNPVETFRIRNEMSIKYLLL